MTTKRTTNKLVNKAKTIFYWFRSYFYRQQVLGELNRRFKEVEYFKDIPLSSQVTAQNFFGIVADYLYYVKNNKTLQHSNRKIEEQREKLKENKKLIEDGNKLIEKMKEDLKYLKSIIDRNNISLLKFEDIFPTGSGVVAVAMSPEKNISLSYIQLDGFLSAEKQFVGDIPNVVAILWSLMGSLKEKGINDKKIEEMDKFYSEQLRPYNNLLRLNSKIVSFYRISDVEKLNEVYDYYFGEERQAWNSLSLRIGNVLDSNTIRPSLTLEEKSNLDSLKNEYFLHIFRYHNHLVDKLEEKPWYEILIRWVFNKIGWSLVIFIIFIIILRFFNIYLPDWILKLLSGK